MTDRLLQLSAQPRMRRLIKGLGLPLPLPSVLSRNDAPLEERPLEDARISMGGMVREDLALAIARAGGSMDASGCEDATEVERAAEAFARPTRQRDNWDALVFDARQPTAGFDPLYHFFHERVRQLVRGGRVLVVGPSRETAPVHCGGLDAFTRSLAKELGRRGSTANLCLVEDGAPMDAAVRFFLSRRSAFVTGQPLSLAALKTKREPMFRRGLEGQVALITGAARGIGAATARLLAREGARIVALDRPGARGLTELAAELEGQALELDITSEDASRRLQDALGDRGVDVIVHNAGVTRDRTIAKMSQQEWDLPLNVNLRAVIHTTDELLASGTLNKGGRVVALSSVSGIAGNAGQTNYALSKGALAAWVRAPSEVRAKHGVTLNGIAPGLIETEMTAAMPAAIREGARRLSALGQGGMPVDVAEAVLLFAGIGASSLDGQVLRVCGGALVGA